MFPRYFFVGLPLLFFLLAGMIYCLVPEAAGHERGERDLLVHGLVGDDDDDE